MIRASIVGGDLAPGEIYSAPALAERLGVSAMGMVIARAGDPELVPLFEKVNAIERAAEDRDVAQFLLADRDFHLSLLALAGNERLVRLVGQLRTQTRLIGIKGLAEAGQLMASALEHRPILEAVCRRDDVESERLMRLHLDHTRESWAGRIPAAELELTGES